MKKKLFLIYFLVLFVFLFSACERGVEVDRDSGGMGAEKISINLPFPECNILSRYKSMPEEVKDECFFPFPFTQFYRDGHVSVPDKVLKNPDGYLPPNLEFINSLDGFSPANQIIFWHPLGFSREGLPLPEQTTGPNSPIQLIELESGERIPVFVEPDARASPPYQVLYIRPLRRMKTQKRYVVVIKNSLKGADGSALDSPVFFEAILKGADIESMESWKEHFVRIVEFLEKQGIGKDEILVAWDFPTASERKIIGEHMFTVRETIYSMQDKITFVIDSVKDKPYAQSNIPDVYKELMAKSVSGTFYVPDYRDQSKLVEARFLLNIPKCVFEDTGSGGGSGGGVGGGGGSRRVKPMIFGHGLFGSEEELDSHNLLYSANYFCMPIIATRWVGIDEEARGEIFSMVSKKVAHPLQVIERTAFNLKQGHANFLALSILVRRKGFWDIVREAVGGFGTSVDIDHENPVYYGISNGGVQGGVFMTLVRGVKFGVLDVGGSIWMFMLERNRSWDPLRNLAYPKGDMWELEVKKLIAMGQMFFDIVDPITFAPYVTRGSDEFDFEPKKIIVREALYDEQVANLATRAFASTAGIPAIKKLIYPPLGVDIVDASDGWNGSGYIQVDPRIPENEKLPEQNLLPPKDPHSQVVRKWWPLLNEGDFVTPHTVPRLVPIILEMQRRFYEEGKIYQLCSEMLCDPD